VKIQGKKIKFPNLEYALLSRLLDGDNGVTFFRLKKPEYKRNIP
jgi:hypothetical protein